MAQAEKTSAKMDPVTSRLVVAVDGPAGAGKGMVCREVSVRLGFRYLDTGSIYRAVGLISLQEGLEAPDELARIARGMDFQFRSVEGIDFRAFLNGRDVSAHLREEKVGQAASRVAALPEVREALLGFQRGYGGVENVLLDGRDVGTVVWPDAPLKIFLTASLEERARRRALELQGRGETVNFHDIQSRMQERDARDAQRAHAPLASATDSVLVDTTRLSREESVMRVLRLVEGLIRDSAHNFKR
ncbi:MAG: (d)CMP kinase [Magnetococcales bacterium]|nr:(d)CMP kinase [Magnetococcales bacterium]